MTVVHNAVVVVIVEISQGSQIPVLREFEADFFVQTGFGLDILVAEEIAGTPPIKTLCAVVGVRIGTGAVTAVVD